MNNIFLSPTLSIHERTDSKIKLLGMIENINFLDSSENAFFIISKFNPSIESKKIHLSYNCLIQMEEKRINLFKEEFFHNEGSKFQNLFLFKKKIGFYHIESKSAKNLSNMIKQMGGIISDTKNTYNDYRIGNQNILSSNDLPLISQDWIYTLYNSSIFINPNNFFLSPIFKNNNNSFPKLSLKFKDYNDKNIKNLNLQKISNQILLKENIDLNNNNDLLEFSQKNINKSKNIVYDVMGVLSSQITSINDSQDPLLDL